MFILYENTPLSFSRDSCYDIVIKIKQLNTRRLLAFYRKYRPIVFRMYNEDYRECDDLAKTYNVKLMIIKKELDHREHIF